jgi:hypothetical protein
MDSEGEKRAPQKPAKSCEAPTYRNPAQSYGRAASTQTPRCSTAILPFLRLPQWEASCCSRSGG